RRYRHDVFQALRRTVAEDFSMRAVVPLCKCLFILYTQGNVEDALTLESLSNEEKIIIQEFVSCRSAGLQHMFNPPAFSCRGDLEEFRTYLSGIVYFRLHLYPIIYEFAKSQRFK
ncbi:hypothetical protein PFISCL1PPCAC_18575, partial [Pristionchus fissidentatus]